MNRGAPIEFAPIRPVPGRIPDQPGAGARLFATDCITGSTDSGRREPDSDLCSAASGCVSNRKPHPPLLNARIMSYVT
jgi:hypothetical protein